MNGCPRCVRPSGYRVRDRTRLTGPLALSGFGERRDDMRRAARRRMAYPHATVFLERLDIAAIGSLEHERGKPARHEGAGVDTDPIAAILGLVADRVPMDHHRSVRIRMGQERFADPPQVPPLL